MLRRLDVRTQSLACLLVGGAIACGSARPVNVGADYIAPAISATPPSPDAGPPQEADSEREEVEAVTDSGQMSVPDDFDMFVGPSWERGEVSPYCRSSFQACGGPLAGTWEVEDNCNPELRTLAVLQSWGQWRMALDQAACWNAVQRLTWSWAGELRFESGFALDDRQRTQNVYVALSASCLSATLGTDLGDSVPPEICEGMQDESTTCALASGVCMCTNRTVVRGAAEGVYAVLGISVTIGRPPTRYEYCVAEDAPGGDRLLWREKEGELRQVVLRRTVDAPPGTKDPVEVPR
jgi:hypothetical protein